MITNYQNIYLIGIGGIGMSALARWFNSQGFVVGGYDLTSSSLTAQLEAEGIEIHYEDLGENIPEIFKDSRTLVIYTPAVPQSHGELIYFRSANYDVRKRSEVLGMLTRSFYTIAVSGTHGKTTTSSMVAHILKESGKNVFAFIGGIARNYESNLLLGDSALGDAIMVVEADEYDRSFLQLYPNTAIITSMDADHLDIYGDDSQVIDSFNAFAAQVASDGCIICREGLPLKNDNSGRRMMSFGQGNSSLQISNIRIRDGAFEFDIEGAETAKGFRIHLPGRHNVYNAVAAFAAAREAGVRVTDIKKALHSFKGVKRRFETIYSDESLVYIDDYAHHPAEIEATLSAARELYQGRKITVVFQPHLFSRTRDFMDEFAGSLSIADEVFLLPIYPARELPLEGITSEVLLEKLSVESKSVIGKDQLIDKIKVLETDILITMGAGDIDRFVEPIKKVVSHEKMV